MSIETDGNAISRRRALKVASAALCYENGFAAAEECAVETLTEALLACRYYLNVF